MDRVEAVFVNSTKDGYDIPCKIWQAKNDQPRAAAFYVHGGAFANGGCDSHPLMSRALSQTLGITIITASFRCGAVAPYRTGTTLQDLKDVTKYFKKKVQGTGLPFGVIGSSSGGYFAMELATQVPEFQFDFCIPICPVAHPGRRASYLKDCISGKAASNPYYGQNCHTPEKAEEMLGRQLSYWETDEAMEAAGELFQSYRIANRGVPPTLLIMGAVDKNVPMHVHQLVQAWATRTIIVGGAGHEIQNEPPTGELNIKKFLWDIDEFLTIVLRKKKNDSNIEVWCWC
mmetsp:Transcript_19337/g.28619  ORF Transcript_19337/g.28619 Transcript_19337/m.28619 type:complete len:287 (+) Transcript_19337:49-909(+)